MHSDDGAAAEPKLFAAVGRTPVAPRVRERVERGGFLSLAGVAQAAQPFVVAWLSRMFPARPLLVVTEGIKAQETFHQDLQTWIDFGRTPGLPPSGVAGATSRLLIFPEWEILPHESRLPHADVIGERLDVLARLGAMTGRGSPDRPLMVASVASLMQRTYRPGELPLRVLRRGDTLDPLDLIEWLEEQAYEPEAQVTEKATLALRGGILDVYPLTSPWPVRLEFFGNELESLRYFDPVTQLSRETIESVLLPPAGELGLLQRRRPAVPTTAADPAEKSLSDEPRRGARVGDPQRVPGEPARRSAGRDGGPNTLRLTEPSQAERVPSPAARAVVEPGNAPLATLLDHLPAATLVVLCEPERLAAAAQRYSEQVPEGDPFCAGWDELIERLVGAAGGCVSLEETGVGSPPPEPEAETEPDSTDAARLGFDSLEAFRPVAERAPEQSVAERQRRMFFDQMHRWLRQGYDVHLFGNNEGELQRFAELWAEYGLGSESPATSLRLELGTLSRGFLCEAARVVVITDAEVFGRYKVQRPRRLKSPHALAVRSAFDINFTDLVEGDYVVHVQHGIGRYAGLARLPASPARRAGEPAKEGVGDQECLVIEYAPREDGQPPPRLYVPIREAHLVGKYVGAGRGRPPLNTLGGTRWAKAKEQATAAVRDLAAELLALQAARAAQAGFACPLDTAWQREFEASFVYEETPDQVRAIEAAKRDMEAAKPMDRLICGDVGFGKTEVAIRAAFKAVMAGRQVAILVPTTVLAQQHYNTFRERMADYPVRIELLSRFRTRRQQDRVIQDLLTGAVDVVIGTHRLVQPDVHFKDLGLVIIDEEQRFGVLHKERLKQLRQLVDVLTLSATPIPRTLYLALTGARDMSTIETPPQDRLPVETVIAPYDERLIRDAIQRELNRGGQVFYLHNRVLDIEAVAIKLRTLLPHVRLGVGHGQMHADDLEEVMARFVNGELDVLLSTTIIESGIDIPNANTIIIDRADRFGLSDLYQLRGRVGRYKHQAYAYLLIPRHAGLLADARKRITAIKQFSTPGSGFKIAMRDLELRGAGNLLGAEQSGHITAVGFELYCDLLKQSIRALKGEPVRRRLEVQLRLDFLDLNPTPETEATNGASDGRRASRKPASRSRPASSGAISVPREVATWVEDPGREWADAGGTTARSTPEVPRASASLPLDYVPEAQHRIELYRRLAQAEDITGLEALRTEVRDRFGPLPPAVELLFRVIELKHTAAAHGITAVETRDDKLMLTRGGDFIQVGGRFPRLTKKQPMARLNEMKRLLSLL